MAFLVGPGISVGAPGVVHSEALMPLGARRVDGDGNEYIYLKGVGSTVVGSWVTFDEAGITALLAANAKGFVAVATAATVANTYGWYLVSGTGQAMLAAATADNAILGRETTDGVAGDGRAAGDEILGAMSRGATAGAAALAAVQIRNPLVNDITGA